MKYGYLLPSDPSVGQLQVWTAVTTAVKSMQRFAGLKDTGVVGEDYRYLHTLFPPRLLPGKSVCDSLCTMAGSDEETMALMNSPRCSLPDQEEPSKTLANPEERNMKRKRRGRKRAISMWMRRNINWRWDTATSS